MAIDAVSQYLKEIGQFPLLTKDEERTLMKKVIRARKARIRLWKIINGWERARRSTKAREQEMVKLIGTCRKAITARETLINSNQRLVFKIARQYANRNAQLDVLDLVNVGNDGLIHAIDNKFEYGKGSSKISTYVVRWIKQRIHRYVKEQRVVAIPEHLVSLFNRQQEAITRINHRTGQIKPHHKEIAKEMGIKENRAKHLELARRRCTSIDTAIQENVRSLDHYLQDSDLPAFETESDNQQIRNLIVQHLHPREAFIILARFGIACPPNLLEELATKAGRSFSRNYFIRKWEDLEKINRPRFDGYTLEEIGEVLCVTRERVRQIEFKAKKKLAKHLKAFDPART